MGKAKLFKRLRKEALLDSVPIQLRKYSKYVNGTMRNADPARREYQRLKAVALGKIEPLRKAWPVSLTTLRRAAHKSASVEKHGALAVVTPQFPGKLRNYGH